MGICETLGNMLACKKGCTTKFDLIFSSERNSLNQRARFCLFLSGFVSYSFYNVLLTTVLLVSKAKQFVCMCVYVCMCVCDYMCMCTCMCTCMCGCMCGCDRFRDLCSGIG